MPTRTDELLEDYKSAINRVRLNIKALLMLTFVGAIAAGSHDGFKGASALFVSFFGAPDKPELFVRWYPLAIGLYAVVIWFQYWERVSLRKRVAHELESGVRDEALSYRLRDDLVCASWMPRILGRSVGQLSLLAAPLLLMLMLWIPFRLNFKGWSGHAASVCKSFGETEHILAWIAAGILPFVVGAFVIWRESRTNQLAIRLSKASLP
jgi:hypothetical protein